MSDLFNVDNNYNSFIFKQINYSDFEDLQLYLSKLEPLTVKRFHPHDFDLKNILSFYSPLNYNQGFIALDIDLNTIIAYSVVHYGYLLYDAERLTSYGLELNHLTDCMYAPSVADQLQGKGIGKLLFQFALNEINSRGFNRVFLWGGVQADNPNAIKFYTKLGFVQLGSFEYQGPNYDMLKIIS